MADDSTEHTTATIRDQLDSSGEFFIVGAPLHAVRAGYVRRQVDDQIYDAVSAGHYAHVLAPDNSGKSSLVAATAARLESNGCKIAILDLALIGMRDGGNDAGRWYYNIAYRLLRQLRIRYDLQAWWQDKSMLSNRQRLVDFYSEVILKFVPERIVVFVDEVQCIENLPFADQLLASIRAAHNARTTDPDFSRLVFVLLGEGDAENLIKDAQLSPFAITKPFILEDFSRDDLDLFATELDLDKDDATAALDRIYYWTNGQPYLVQKAARAVARAGVDGDIATAVDHIVVQQLGGRAAVTNEPHLNHIHQAIVNDTARREQLLNLYGKIRKGVDVPADLGSPLQRKLIALGLLKIDSDGGIRVRNRLYASVFTARWANENLPMSLRVPLMAIGLLLLLALIPFWYTQWLPVPYVEVLTSETADLDVATDAYSNFRSFPGHTDTADGLYRRFLTERALAASTESEVLEIANRSRTLPGAADLPEVLQAGFWDRRALAAMRDERRDDALLATVQSLIAPTPLRRQRAASLVADDYPTLLATLPGPGSVQMVFDPAAMIVTSADGETVSQWSYTKQMLNRRQDWKITALEVNPLVRRVIVDRKGVVQRTGLTLNISHARLSDLRIKVIAPSGRAVEVETGLERASSDEDIRIAAEQLTELVGEPLEGTWTISVRDENPGVAGQLVGWNLKLNSQGIVEEFQRGLNIPEPVERETDNIWFDASGRYAVARATQSDSARIWDLAFAEPVRAIAVNESEDLIGLDPGARRLVTATQDLVNVWDTASGDRIASIPIRAPSDGVKLTADGKKLFVELRSDDETRLEMWSLESREMQAEVIVAGVPSLVAIDPTGKRVAAADYDRAIRIWDFETGELRGQVDLPAQPSAIRLAAGGDTLGVVYGDSGIALWQIGAPMRPLHEEFAAGDWQLVFSPSGSSVLVGEPNTGFQMYATSDGRRVGPQLGLQDDPLVSGLLAYSLDEQVLLTGNSDGLLRFWKASSPPTASDINAVEQDPLWNLSAGNPVVILPGAKRMAIGDEAGHVHIVAAGTTAEDIRALSGDVSFVGHLAQVRQLAASDNGELLTSVAADNSLRVWATDSGQPLPYTAQIDGPPVVRIVFSPDASKLGVLNGDHVRLLSVADGAVIARFKLAEPHDAIAFAGDGELYLGDANGTLRLLETGADGDWKLRQLWQGSAGIRWLEASPRGEYLVLVDENNLASQFVLGEGRITSGTLALPGDVQDVAFDGSRVLFRTSRWVHRASVSVAGLGALDSAFVPKALNGAHMQATANGTYLATASAGFIELVELGFDGAPGPMLFGNRDELLAEWRLRLQGIAALLPQ